MGGTYNTHAKMTIGTKYLSEDVKESDNLKDKAINAR